MTIPSITSSVTSTQSLTSTAANSTANTASFSDIYASINDGQSNTKAPIIGFVDAPIDTGFLGATSSANGNTLQINGNALDASLPIFAGNMRRAFAAYGIPTQPPVQLVTNPDGSITAPPNDPRGPAITKMFKEQPELAQQYARICISATFAADERDAQAEALVAAKFGDAYAKQAMNHWEENERRMGNTMGISFNGPTATLTEKVGGTWQSPRTVDQIADEMVPGTNFIAPPSIYDQILGAGS